MKKNNLKLFWLVLLSVFILSCSFETKNTGDISFNLPNRAAGSIGNIEFSVQVIKDGNIIYDGTNSGDKFTIKDIPAGKCVIKIFGQDLKFEYTGQNTVEIIAGKTVPCEIKLTKGEIGSGGGSTPEDGGESLPPAGSGVTTFAALRTKIKEAKGPTTIVLDESFTTDSNTSAIVINKDITIQASKAVTITKGSNFKTNALFDVNPDCSLTIKGTASAPITLDGGSVACEAPLIRAYGNLTLEHCVLQNNNNTKEGTTKNLWGGAIYCGGDSTDKVTNDHKLTLSNTTVKNITTTKVGAVYVNQNKKGTNKTTVTITDCTISSNNIYQGALNFENTGDIAQGNTLTATIKNTTISENTAISNGSGILVDNCNVTLDGGSITSNTANNGGAMYIQKNTSVVTLSNGVSISGNKAKAVNGNLVGGVYVNQGTLKIVKGSISNSAHTDVNKNPVYNVHLGMADAKLEINGKTATGNNKSYTNIVDENIDPTTAG